MAEYNRSNFETYYGTSGSTFADNTSGDISALDMRTFGKDISDSFDLITKFITASGTDTYTGSISSSPAIASGLKIFIKFTNANTGASTFNLNSTGAVTLRSHDGTALAAGNIAAGSVWVVVYDGVATQWRLMGPVPSSGGTISGLTTNRIPYATGSTTLGDDSGLTWDATNNAITINNVRIHGKGTSQNTFIGESSGNLTTTTSLNTGVGYGTLASVTTTGNANTAVGWSALNFLTTGLSNVAIGVEALLAVVSGSGNTSVGANSLNNTTGSNNVALGYAAGGNITSGSSNIMIGYYISAQSATGSNQLSIQNAIFGSGNSGTTTTISNGNLGFWATSWGTSAAKVISIGSGTAPATSPADITQVYSADISAGNAAFHTRAEGGEIISLGSEVGMQSNHDLKLVANSTEYLRLNTSGNLGLGITTWGTSAAGVFAIGNGTAPTTSVANAIQLFSTDSSDATATLGLYLEQAVETIGTFTASHKLKIKINGTEYWIELDAV